MSRPLFTPEELEELRRADAEIDNEFEETWDEVTAARKRGKPRADASKHKESDARYRLNHKEKIRARQKAYRESHKEQAAAYYKTYYEEHKEQIRANMRVYEKNYYRKNRDTILTKQRERRKMKRESKGETLCTSTQNTNPSGM